MVATFKLGLDHSPMHLFRTQNDSVLSASVRPSAAVREWWERTGVYNIIIVSQTRRFIIIPIIERTDITS